MPRTSFDQLPDSARLWVFACDPHLTVESESWFLRAADEFLDDWRAHGEPLTCARDWRERRFLAVAVDQRTAGASGCSIDGMFRALRALEPRTRSRLVGGSHVFFRDSNGKIRCVSRDEFESLATRGDVGPETKVFDTSITTAGEWRTRFEVKASDSWHASLLPESAARRSGSV